MSDAPPIEEIPPRSNGLLATPAKVGHIKVSKSKPKKVQRSKVYFFDDTEGNFYLHPKFLMFAYTNITRLKIAKGALIQTVKNPDFFTVSERYDPKSAMRSSPFC